MEEIEGRFELIRIAVHLGDYEVIDTQMRHLRNMSIDKHLHAILYELDSKNFRQALYLMKDYAETLRDDFFNPPLAKSTPTPAGTSEPTLSYPEPPPSRRQPAPQSASVSSAPDSSATREPQAVENDLFSLSASEPYEERILGLEEMLKMTKDSASAPRPYAEPEPDAFASTVEPRMQKPQRQESNTPPPETDPLFTLDQDMVPADERPGKPAKVSPAELTVPDELRHETQPESREMTPLFDTASDLGDGLLTFPDEEEPVVESETPLPTHEIEDGSVTAESMSEPGIFALDEPPTPEADLPAPEETVSETPPHAQPTMVTPSEETESAMAPMKPIDEALPVSEPESEQMPRDVEPDRRMPNETFEEDPRPRRWEFEPDEDDVLYDKFAYMGQKFRNMMHQYPRWEEVEDGTIQEVQDFIHMVSTHDYSESQVEAAVARYQDFKEQGRIAEAAQMLIAAATTESTFAQFMLARELFKGDVLQQDFPESFTQINRLAEEDYPEAICDLGQLYEYGIGIDKNKRHALLLYEEAAHMGVARAQRHYERLRNSNPLQSIKSLTTSLFRRKK